MIETVNENKITYKHLPYLKLNHYQPLAVIYYFENCLFFYFISQSYWSGLGVHSGRHPTQSECVPRVEHSHRCLHRPLYSAATTNPQTHQPLHTAGAGGLP